MQPQSKNKQNERKRGKSQNSKPKGLQYILGTRSQTLNKLAYVHIHTHTLVGRLLRCLLTQKSKRKMGSCIAKLSVGHMLDPRDENDQGAPDLSLRNVGDRIFLSPTLCEATRKEKKHNLTTELPFTVQCTTTSRSSNDSSSNESSGNTTTAATTATTTTTKKFVYKYCDYCMQSVISSRQNTDYQAQIYSIKV